MFWRKIKGGRGKGVAQGRGRVCYLGQALREGLPAGSEELSPAHGLVLAKVESSRVPGPETQWAGQDGRSARATSDRMEGAKGDGKRNQVHSGSTPQPALRILASTWGIWEGSGGFGRGALWSALGFKDLIQPVWRADLRKRKQGREERSVLRLCDRPGKRERRTEKQTSNSSLLWIMTVLSLDTRARLFHMPTPAWRQDPRSQEVLAKALGSWQHGNWKEFWTRDKNLSVGWWGVLPWVCLWGRWNEFQVWWGGVDITGGSDGKASIYNAGDPDSNPSSGRSPGEGNGNPLQYSCLENPMDGGAW